MRVESYDTTPRRCALRLEHSFPAGHRLPNHKGLCRHIHGHNYLAEMYFNFTTVLNNADGFDVDFSNLKEVCRSVLSRYDHAFFVHKDDVMLSLIEADDAIWSPIVMPAPPSAENICAMLVEEIATKVRVCRILPDALPFVLTLKLWETHTNAVSMEYTSSPAKKGTLK